MAPDDAAMAPDDSDASAWFAVRPLAPGLTAITEDLGEVDPRWGPTLIHAYLLESADHAVLVDAGLGVGDLHGLVGRLTDRPVDLVLTHYHYDHVAEASRFERIAIGRRDGDLLREGPTPEMARLAATIPGRCGRPTPPGFDWATWRVPPATPTRLLADGDRLDLGDLSLVALETPGHTPGSICYLCPERGWLFTGDTLLEGDHNLELEMSHRGEFRDSIERLASVAADVDLVLPAHGPLPVDPSIAREVRDALAAIDRGDVAPVARSGSRIADFGRFAVTFP